MMNSAADRLNDPIIEPTGGWNIKELMGGVVGECLGRSKPGSRDHGVRNWKAFSRAVAVLCEHGWMLHVGAGWPLTLRLWVPN